MKKNTLKKLIILFLVGILAFPQVVFATGNRDWRWPVPSSNSLSSCYLDGRSHYALDISATGGSSIYASYPGTVIYTYTGCAYDYGKSGSCPCGSCGGLGNSVYIKHSYNGVSYVSRYGHMRSVNVSVGQTVTKDTVIGTIGSTGYSSGNHLDFRIYKGSTTSHVAARDSMDPFKDNFLEMPSGLNANAATTACCYTYVDEVKAQYLDSESPVVSDIKVTDISSTGYTVTCTVSDDVGVTSVSFPTWPYPDGSWNPVWHEGTISGNTATCRINVSEHGNIVNTNYATHIYAYDAAGNSGTGLTDWIYIDGNPPVISNVVVEADSEGYTITCDVEDSSEIDRAMFPTWTTYNGQDDLEGADGSWPALECHRGTVSNGKASFRVNRSDHNDEYGEYSTHIYIYDVYENGTVEKIRYTLEEHQHEYTSEITKEATCTKEGVRTYTCSCGENYTESIEATGHNYSNGSCTKCGAEDPDYETEVDVNSPQIIVESKAASPGDSVDVMIALKNNPGVASMKLKVSFDSILTLENITYNSSIGGQSQQPQNMTSPVTLNWYNGSADSEGDWTFATLTFQVSEDAEADTTANVTVTYNADDVYDISETNVDFTVQNGEIIISDYLPGDINGDGYVNNKDLTRLFQYLSDWDVEVVHAALDVNGDGNINNKDQTRLFQYLSDWDVAIY